MRTNYDTIDKAMLGISGALMLVGIVVLGLVEVLTGKPHGASAVEETNEAGEVVTTIAPTVDPTIRTGLVLAGLLVLLFWGIYRMYTPTPDRRGTPMDVTAD
jgi:hypothetical protein